ncbi:hypothetical protein RB653_007216 [Dictyostelium firmibasis]|uniref:Uncharacterized protein n=1 Tax=Dictyostelium firmibasis TaxID=79012 RepID=A0AAN7U3D2_9MYCE
MTNFLNQSKQSLILTSVLGCAVGLGYYLTNYYKPSDESKHEYFYKKAIQTHILKKINNNNKEINIIITYSLKIPIDVVKRTAKYIYNNIDESYKVNLFSIEYSEIEHFNDSKEKSTFDAVIVIDESSNSIVTTHSSQSSLSNSNIKKFSKISVLLKPSSPFLTFYYQQQQQQQRVEEPKLIENEIVSWNSNNILENKMFYELCGFNVESITNETLEKSSIYLVVSKSPDWAINSRDNLFL